MVGELEESKKPLDRNRGALVDAGADAGADSGAETGVEAAGADGGEREGQAAGSDSEGEDAGVPTSSQRKKEKDVRKIEDEPGDCSSGGESQVSSETEGEQYVEDAQPIKYKIIEVKL